METTGPRRRPEGSTYAPTTLHEITRRYYATAVALAKAMGLPFSEEFMRQHRESISTCFIEAGRAGVRLPPAVQLPPLAQANGHTEAPVTEPVREREGTSMASTNGQPAPGTVAPIPVTIPKGWPSGGVAIADLKPSSLAMLLGKVGQLMHTKDRDAWVGLLAALQAERGKRMAQGRQPPREG
jgi:hypothetical protein